MLRGSWRKHRGVAVETLGAAMEANLHTHASGVKWLTWTDIHALAARDDATVLNIRAFAN